MTERDPEKNRDDRATPDSVDGPITPELLLEVLKSTDPKEGPLEGPAAPGSGGGLPPDFSDLSALDRIKARRQARRLSPEARQVLLAASEDVLLKYLLEVDYPDWDLIREHEAFTEKWVVLFLQRSRAISSEAVQDIYRHRILRRDYHICRAIVRCRFAPQGVAMNLVPRLRWVDLMQSLRLPYLSGAVKFRIEKQVMEVLPKLALGQKIALAKQAPRALVRHLRMDPDPKVMRALLQNHYFTHDDAMFLANYGEIPAQILGVLASHPRWNHFKDIKLSLLRNAKTPRGALMGLTKGMTEYDFKQVLRDPRVPVYTRRLIERIMEERFFDGKRRDRLAAKANSGLAKKGLASKKKGSHKPSGF